MTMNNINYICPVCKHVKDVPKGTPATCNYCSEQMTPTASVAGRKILEPKKKESDK